MIGAVPRPRGPWPLPPPDARLLGRDRNPYQLRRRCPSHALLWHHCQYHEPLWFHHRSSEFVVDDAIITGENIYTRLREDLTPLDAAVLGTKEVTTPVTFGSHHHHRCLHPPLLLSRFLGELDQPNPPYRRRSPRVFSHRVQADSSLPPQTSQHEPQKDGAFFPAFKRGSPTLSKK